LRFGYQGKWSPCVCESLNTKGESITLMQQQLRGGEQQRDMSKVRCFACNQLGHYAGQCTKKKKKKRKRKLGGKSKSDRYVCS
jgi:hypothetical protein